MVSKKEAKVRILVVDDEKDQRCFMERSFSGLGYIVFLAATGDEAREILKAKNPDIVILDMKLQRTKFRNGVRIEEGLELLESIKKDTPNKKVIMVTGLSDDETIDQIKQLGADDYITKPVSLEYVVELVNAMSNEIARNK